MKWPQRVVNGLGREPQVGDWFAECCIEDFFQIPHRRALSALLEHYDDMDTGGRFWRQEDGATARAELLAEATPDAGTD